MLAYLGEIIVNHINVFCIAFIFLFNKIGDEL